MAKGAIDVRKADTILDELNRLHHAISERAYDLFRNGGSWGGALADWLAAERELIARPAIELRQTDGRFEVLAALPGVDVKDVDIQVTPDDLLIKAHTKRERRAEEGTLHVSEISTGKLFRSIHFPAAIDPRSAKAEYKNGMLQLTAEIAKATAEKKVDIAAS